MDSRTRIHVRDADDAVRRLTQLDSRRLRRSCSPKSRAAARGEAARRRSCLRRLVSPTVILVVLLELCVARCNLRRGAGRDCSRSIAAIDSRKPPMGGHGDRR